MYFVVHIMHLASNMECAQNSEIWLGTTDMVRAYLYYLEWTSAICENIETIVWNVLCYIIKRRSRYSIHNSVHMVLKTGIITIINLLSVNSIL